MKKFENSFNSERPFPSVFRGIDIRRESETIANPFSGEECLLEPDAVAVYDLIKGSESVENYTVMQLGLDWFRKYFPQEYMTLLD
jgi:hypothetical protein